MTLKVVFLCRPGVPEQKEIDLAASFFSSILAFLVLTDPSVYSLQVFVFLFYCLSVCLLLFHLEGTCYVALRSLLDSAAVVEGVTACSSCLLSAGAYHHSNSSKQMLAPRLTQLGAGYHNPVY